MGLWKVTRIEAFQVVTSETSDSNIGNQVCEANTVRRVPVTLIQTEGKGRPLQTGMQDGYSQAQSWLLLYPCCKVDG